jgi:hypothetical protein
MRRVRRRTAVQARAARADTPQRPLGLLPIPASRRSVNSEHAHCHVCRNPVRRDWLRCLHCDAPAARPLGRTLVHAAVLAFATTVATVGVMRGESLWRYVNGEPVRLVSEAVAATAAAASESGPATAMPRTRAPIARPGAGTRIERLAADLTPSGTRATVPLATVAGSASPTTAGQSRCFATGAPNVDSTSRRWCGRSRPARPSRHSTASSRSSTRPSRAIRRCGPGSRAVRQLEARRAQLAQRATPHATRGARAGLEPVPVR